MPISPSPTQVGLSVANASELSAVSVTQFSAGEIAYKRDDKTYWSLDLGVTASGGYPTASGQGRWVPFPGGSTSQVLSAIVFQPGGVTGGNVITTDAELIAYITDNDDPQVVFDLTLSPTPGQYTFPQSINHNFGRWSASSNSFTTVVQITIPDGVTITNPPIFDGVAILLLPSTVPSFAFTAQNQIVVQNGAQIANEGSIPAIASAHAGFTFFVFFCVGVGSSIGGATPILNVTAPEFAFVQATQVNADSSSGNGFGVGWIACDPGAALLSYSYTDAAFIAPSLPGFLGSAFVEQPIDVAQSVFYAPAVIGNWPSPPPAQVAAALDELAARGGGTIPTTLIVDLTAATNGVGTLASPFNSIQSAINALVPGGATQTISISSGTSTESLTIPPTGLSSVVLEGQGSERTLIAPPTGSSLEWIAGTSLPRPQGLTLRGLNLVSQDGSPSVVLDGSAVAGGVLSDVLIDDCVIGAQLAGSGLSLTHVLSCTVTGLGTASQLFSAGGGVACLVANSNLTIEGDTQVSGGIDWTYDPTVNLSENPAKLSIQGNAFVDLVTFHELAYCVLGPGATILSIATPDLSAGTPSGAIPGVGFMGPCFVLEGTLGDVTGAAPLPTVTFNFPSLGGNVPALGPRLIFNPSCSIFAAMTVSNADAGTLSVDGRGIKLPKGGLSNATQPTIAIDRNIAFDLSNASFTTGQLSVTGSGSSFVSNAILSGDVTVSGFGIATVVGLNRFPLDPITTAAPPAGDLLQSNGADWIAAPSGSGPTFAITSLTSPAGTLFPVGTTLANPLVLNATYNMAATSADSIATAGPSPVAWAAPYTTVSIPFAYGETTVNSTVTFTLQAASGASNATRQLQITWTAYIRWEALPDPGPGGYTAAFIEALANQQLQTTFNANVTMVLGAGDYAFEAFPSVYGTPTFYITQTGQPQNPFAGGMSLVAAAVPILVNGVTVPMDLYRSDYPSFGSASFLTN